MIAKDLKNLFLRLQNESKANILRKRINNEKRENLPVTTARNACFNQNNRITKLISKYTN